MLYDAYNTLLMEHSGSICYICDPQTYELMHLTQAGMRACGLTCPEEYLGKKCYQVLQGLDAPCPFCTNSRLKEGQDYRWEHHNANLNRWFDVTDSLIRVDGKLCRMEIARDITARKELGNVSSVQFSMEDILFRCLHTLTSEKDMNIAMNRFLEDIGTYYHASRAYIFEFDLEQDVLNNSFEWCAPGVSAEIDNLQSIPIEVVSDWIHKFKTVGEFSISSLDADVSRDTEEYRILEAQGIQSLMAAPLLQDDQIVGFIGVDDPSQKTGNLTLLRSVSKFVRIELEKRRMMIELEHMSYTDMLTGANNRNQYIRTLKRYELHAPDALGVIFVDVNGMKLLNDTHGHSFGDYILRQTVRIMRENLSGVLFRIGGDEFVVLCENIPHADFESEVQQLRKVFAENRECNVSIGGIWRDGDININQILLQADEMMYAEKQAYYHNTPENRRGKKRAGVSREIQQEIADGCFLVYYQPQVDIKTKRIIGAEALVRKKSPNGQLVPPSKFIPLYETEGVIGYLDLFVLQESCAVLQKWLEQGHDLHLSVNFSRITLMAPDIVEKISAICADHRVSTSSITIEVTESVGRMDPDMLKALIRSLNDAGFTISLDDFGSEYSNLAIVSEMDFDEIKFDKTLVDSLEHSRKSRIVMENSVKMCRSLEGTSSLAEGIETQGQLDLLLHYDCDYGQGFYFSKPIPEDEFTALLQTKL